MLRSTFSSLREYLTPITHVSTFSKTGEITPEEFVLAGDYLVYKFPTWQWSPAPDNKKRDFLPDDKQFLVSRHIPSYIRASDYEDVNEVNSEEDGRKIEGEEDLLDGDEEGWTKTDIFNRHEGRHCSPLEERRHSQQYVDMKERDKFNEIDVNNDIDELIEDDAEDIIDNEAQELKVNDQGEIIDEDINNLPIDVKKRSYDLYITYSTSYRVPKMYLVGFNFNGVPLKPNEMFEDIASDYRHKTVTIEKAPFLNDTTSVSIHPCKHSNVMKVLMKRANIAAKNRRIKEQQLKSATNTTAAATTTTTTADDLTKGVSKLGLADSADDDWETVDHDQEEEEGADGQVVRVDQYLIIFLKFISSVTPGIEHDYTMDAF